MPSPYFFMYEMLIFFLSVLKENLSLTVAACTGKCSLPIANTDRHFSNSTFFLVVTGAQFKPWEAVTDGSYWSSPSCTEAAPLPLLEVSSSQSHSPVAQAYSDGIHPFPYTETPLMLFLLLGDTKRQGKRQKTKALGTVWDCTTSKKSALALIYWFQGP